MGATAARNRELDTALRHCARSALGAEVERLEEIPGQLGLRRFVRVHLAGGEPRTAIARVEAPEDPAGRPADAPPEPPLEPVRALLEACGLPVPKRLGSDTAAGIELLEDLGDQSLTRAAAAADTELRRALYAEACDLVPRLQRVSDPGGVAAFRRHLDPALFAYKADLFARWSLAERDRETGAAEREVVRTAFAEIAAGARAAPQRLAHRDFQSSNLMVRPGRAAGERLAMIDLQGALLAPPEYDLVCLLRDSYVELGDAEVSGAIERIRPALPDAPDPDEFAQRFDLLTLTRKGKDHARFLYAAHERGNTRYLRTLPATVRALRAAARRAAERESRWAALAELIEELPETACAR